MAAPQTLLLASGVESSNITAWDLHTCTQLSTFKGNASGRNGVCLLGRDYLVSAQSGKDALHFWTWHKDQVVQRSFTVEAMVAVAASLDGALVAGGAASGTIYVWEAASGRLLRSWAAHYKSVSCLSFADNGTMLVSGGDDTLSAVWLLADLLDAAIDPAAPQNARPQPLYSWSDHTLPVTALCCGQGGADALIATASADRTVKLYRLGDGSLLRSVQLPVPLLSLVLDAGEHAFYAGGSDGAIFEVSLVGDAQRLASGLGAGAAVPAGSQYAARMDGHTRGVNSLSMSSDGEYLASGSDDGTARIWDLRSRQPVHVVPSPGHIPVTSVLVLDRPPHLAGAGGTAGQRRGPTRMQPLAPFVKYVGMAGAVKAWEGPLVVLDGTVAVEDIVGLSGLLPSVSYDTAAASDPAAAGGSGSAQDEEVVRLRAELAAAQAAAAQWRALHGELHKFSLEAMDTG